MAEEITLEDPNITAFIWLTSNKTPAPKLREFDRRVCFTFQSSDEIKKLLQEYHTNPRVPLLDYVEKLKSVRSAIFNLRASAGGSHDR